MDLFKYVPVSSDTTLDTGASINDYARVTWVERYSEPGEFTIEAKLSSGLSEFLPLGTMISHIDTTEVMIVENQEVEEKFDEDPTITITGRSFISFFENRIVGANSARSGSTLSSYVLASGNSWAQLVTIINAHIINPPASVDDALTNVLATHSLTGSGSSSDSRTIDHSDLLKTVLDLLKVDDLGIRTIRRNPFGIPSGSSTQSIINIYKGVDKTNKVMFSWVSGDIDQAQYLFSQKNNKNSALVLSKYLQLVVDGPQTKYRRRMMVVDASDIDGPLTTPPVGATLVSTLAAMTTRGKQALANQNLTSLTQVDLSDSVRYKYRVDYNLGDLVSIDGNFGQIAVKRVSEYAEIEDEDGTSGNPTFTDPLS